jgi:hypothetical protein
MMMEQKADKCEAKMCHLKAIYKVDKEVEWLWSSWYNPADHNHKQVKTEIDNYRSEQKWIEALINYKPHGENDDDDMLSSNSNKV